MPGQISPKSPEPAIAVTTVAFPTVPVAVTCNVGNPASLLAIVMSDVRVPAAVGVKLNGNGKQKSWLIVTGRPADGGATANSAFAEAIEVTTRSFVPVLQTLNVVDCVSPTHAELKAGV